MSDDASHSCLDLVKESRTQAILSRFVKLYCLLELALSG